MKKPKLSKGENYNPIIQGRKLQHPKYPREAIQSNFEEPNRNNL